MLDRLGPFEQPPRLAAAVSGGPDSMSLAFLTDGWVRCRGGSLLALVVDHGLRPASADEAMLTARRLAAAAIEARILRWEGAKPATGIQAAARRARYGLLEGACRAQGILHLLLGHQREDQAETVAMRAASGSGSTGMAGMPAVSEASDLRRLRLELRRVDGRVVSVELGTSRPMRAPDHLLRLGIDQAMPGDLVQHVVEETDAGGQAGRTRAVQVDGHVDLRFLGVAADVSASHGMPLDLWPARRPAPPAGRRSGPRCLR